jgi:Fe-S-cluster containining protein
LFKKFRCVEGCSDCCINREYFPSKKFGKIGVLVLPDEKVKLEQLAKSIKVKIKILPRIGISRNDDESSPEQVIVYQLMGKESDGNLCPFLETDGSERSPHGGARCRIYDNRPLACKAYPLVSIDPIISTLDKRCTFCASINENRVFNLGIDTEIKALSEIIALTRIDDAAQLWRYATNIGDPGDKKMLLREGWVKLQ